MEKKPKQNCYMKELKKYIKNFKQILLQIENLDISFIKKKESFTKKENKNNLIKNFIDN